MINLEFGRRTVPVILQSEAAECGLACIAMIASHHGLRTDLAALRSRYSLSLTGATLADLGECATQLHLVAHAAQLELDELPQLQVPCILHWNLNHYVVLVKANATDITIHDPAVGLRRLTYAEASPCFSGIAMELQPGPRFVRADQRRRLHFAALVGNVRGLWSGLAKVFAMAVTLELLGILSPMLNQWITDEALTSGDHDMLTVVAAGSLLLMVMQAALSQWRGWTLMYLSTHMSVQWRTHIMTHLLRLPMAWFETRHMGDVVSRFNASDVIQKKLTGGLVSAVLDGIMSLATLALMLMYSGAMTVIVLVAVVLYALLRVASYSALRVASHEGLALSAQEQSCMMETIRAIQPIKLAGRELDRCTRWHNLLVESINRSVRTQKLNLVFSNLYLLVNGVATVLLFRTGAGMVMEHAGFTIGMLMAFMSYSSQFGSRMHALVDNLIEFRMLGLSCDRLADIVLEAPEPQGQEHADITQLAARIEVVNVGFRYSDNGPWVLRNVSLTIEAGESVALIGPSGGGKTTLVKLILGTLTPTEGEIRYGGVPLRQLGTRAYRSIIGTVMQDDQLIAGSLRDNITFFDDRPSAPRVEVCARTAAIHADIERMPMRYNTLVGDMGMALSGGQKQRLFLARALYKRPKLLVLDEATSHLDVGLEHTLNTAVARLNLTRIIVAHRPETIASAGRVVPLVGGTIVPLPDHAASA